MVLSQVTGNPCKHGFLSTYGHGHLSEDILIRAMVARSVPWTGDVGWAEVDRRNGIENQSQSGRHTNFLNGIEIFIT